MPETLLIKSRKLVSLVPLNHHCVADPVLPSVNAINVGTPPSVITQGPLINFVN